MKSYDYEATLKLTHKETAGVLNKETGEFKEIKSRPAGHMVKHDKNMTFKKIYPKSWALLKKMTTKRQYMVAFELAQMAHAFTNSLRPLNPNSSTRELEEILSVNKSLIKKDIDVLHELGVIGMFSVGELVEHKSLTEIKEYWIFNPYLSFNGNVILSDLARLFQNTLFAKIYNN
jgi:hypothetical protein